jgi:hypothetical protein
MDGARYIKPEAEGEAGSPTCWGEAEPDADPELTSESENSESGSEHVIKREERLTPGQEGALCHSRNRPACLLA